MSGRVVRSPFLQAAAARGEFVVVHERTLPVTVGLTASEFAVVLRHRTDTPVAVEELGTGAAFFLGHRLFLAEGEAERRLDYDVLEVEINRHCNFRCTFCPVATEPYPRAFISDEVFALVLDRATEFGIRGISLNHYSEPTLNPKLLEYMRKAIERGHWIRLCTNASLLDEDKIGEIAALGSVYMQINLPSVDRAGFTAATGAAGAMFDRVLRNLDQIVELEIEGELVVNWTDAHTQPQVRAIKERYGAGSLRVIAWQTDSRAGLLAHVGTRVDHAGTLLTGCNLAANQIQVSWEGDVFLCCQDFAQQTKFGNLAEQSLAEIALSEAFVKTRRQILGLEAAPREMICNRCEHTCAQGDHPKFGIGGALPSPDRISISPSAHAAGFSATRLRIQHHESQG